MCAISDIEASYAQAYMGYLALCEARNRRQQAMDRGHAQRHEYTYWTAHKNNCKPRTHFGTHKGHRCQEGVRTWPGDYACRRAGLTALLDPSSQLSRSSRRAAGGQAGAPAAAQWRGRTSLTPASGGRSFEGGEGSVAGWLMRGRVLVPGAWRAEWSHKHPSGAAPACGAAAMTMCPGPGCSVR